MPEIRIKHINKYECCFPVIQLNPKRPYYENSRTGIQVLAAGVLNLMGMYSDECGTTLRTTSDPVLGGNNYKIITPYPSYLQDSTNISADSVNIFVYQSTRTDVVNTIYDTAALALDTIPGLDAQTNLRKRVAAVKFFEGLSPSDVYYQHYTYATHYSYDIDGNVKTLVQDFPALKAYDQEYKRIDYDYDLISGKVNLLSYNRGGADQFYQRYGYDDDNRITKVETSNDGYIWACPTGRAIRCYSSRPAHRAISCGVSATIPHALAG
jgi:hypothetical protein